MAYTSFGTRKALGKRYSVDPAILLEAQRLEQEYNLAPGREARGIQASQFASSQGQQASQFAQSLQLQKDAQEASGKSGMVQTGVGLLQTAMMVDALTGGKVMKSLYSGAGESVVTPKTVVPAAMDAATGSAGIAAETAAASGGMTSASGAVMGSAAEGFAAAGTGAEATGALGSTATLSGVGGAALTGLGYGAAGWLASQYGKNILRNNIQYDAQGNPKTEIGGIQETIAHSFDNEHIWKGPPDAFVEAGVTSTFGKGAADVVNTARDIIDPVSWGVTKLFEAVGLGGNSKGTWICTEIEKKEPFSAEQYGSLSKLRRYSIKNHNEDARAYLRNGFLLIKNLTLDLDYLKVELVEKCCALVKEDKMEEAFNHYKEVVARLCEESGFDYEPLYKEVS
jgi:hypothetical protein